MVFVAHGSLCEVEKVEHSVKEMVSGLRPGFKTLPCSKVYLIYITWADC